MNSQKLSLAVLFVFGLSIESWASMRDAISEVGAEPENTISAAFVLPEGTAFVLPEGTMLINGKIDSNQDTDLLQLELNAATTFSTEVLGISPALDRNLIEFIPFGQGLAGDDDSAGDDSAGDSHQWIHNDSEIFVIQTTEPHGLAGPEDGHDDIHYVIFYRVDSSQTVHTMDSGVIPEPTTFAVWSLLGLTFAGAGSRRRHRA